MKEWEIGHREGRKEWEEGARSAWEDGVGGGEERVRGGSGRLEVGSVGEGRERRTIFRLWRMHSFSLSAVVQMK